MSAQPTSAEGYLLKLKDEKEIYSDQVWLATGTCSSLQSMECLHYGLRKYFIRRWVSNIR